MSINAIQDKIDELWNQSYEDKRKVKILSHAVIGENCKIGIIPDDKNPDWSTKIMDVHYTDEDGSVYFLTEKTLALIPWTTETWIHSLIESYKTDSECLDDRIRILKRFQDFVEKTENDLDWDDEGFLEVIKSCFRE